MSLLSSRSVWSTVAVLALLPVTSVYARPIQESTMATQVQPATNIQARNPRLIPDTENYLANLFDLLGLQVPKTSDTPIATPTLDPSISTPTLDPSISTPTLDPSIHITDEEDKPVSATATPTPISNADSATITQPAMYTTTIHRGDTDPIENIQIGTGWTGGKQFQASDLPVLFDAVAKELGHRVHNMVDSSDERGLGNDAEANKRVLESNPNSDDFAVQFGDFE